MFSVYIVWVHFKFNSFPDEPIHVSGFSGKELDSANLTEEPLKVAATMWP
jgi:hypothetical protein